MQPRKRGGDRVTRFVFTLNNWTQEEYDYLTTKFAPTTKWFVVGKETGVEGTKHLQGACVLGARQAFTKLKSHLGLKRSHIEVMMGRPEDSLLYCTKEDTDAFTFGTLPTPGKRNDVHDAVSRIQSGERLRSLARDEEGGVAIVKFHKGLTVLSSFCRPARNGPPKVFWLYGDTGTGKTRCAFEAGSHLAAQSGNPTDDVWISSGGLRWFDGYDGQAVAILDDFRNKHVSSFAFFLRLLDRYPMAVEFKGGFATWDPKFIFITCPYTPERCFEKRLEHVPEDIAQLRRRITRVFEFDSKSSSESARKKFIDGLLEPPGSSGDSGTGTGDSGTDPEPLNGSPTGVVGPSGPDADSDDESIGTYHNV